MAFKNDFLLWTAVVWMLVCSRSRGAELFQEGSGIDRLVSGSFDRILGVNHTAAIVLFYAPYCQQTQKFAPVFKSVAQSFKGVIRLAVVDCSETVNHGLCRRFDISGFPTIKVFSVREVTRSEASVKGETYTGSLTAKGISNVIKSAITDEKIVRLKSEEDWKKAQEQDVSKVLLFTNKDASTLLHMSLSWKYHPHAVFHEIHSHNRAVIDAFNVTDFPSLLVVKDGGVHKFRGTPDAVSLHEFLDDVLNLPRQSTEYVPMLRSLSSDDLDKIDGDESVWLVAFYSDPQGTGCIEDMKKFEETVKRLKEMVRIGTYNLTAHPSHSHLKDMEIDTAYHDGHPCKMTIVRFPFGMEKNKKDDYGIFEGNQTFERIQEFAWDTEMSHPFPIDADSMPYFLGARSEKGETRPKVLYFSDRTSFSPLCLALKMALRHWQADVGIISPTEKQLQQDFHVQTVPALRLVFFDHSKDVDEQMIGRSYEGPIEFGSMRAFTEAFLITQKTEKTEYLDPFFNPETMAYVKRLRSDTNVDAFCTETVPLCVFFILDEDDKKFQFHLEQLEIFYLQQSLEQGPYSLAWMEAKDCDNFMHVFGIGKGDLPGIAAYSPKKRRYVASKRDVRPKRIQKFLKGVVAGWETTFPLEEWPTLMKSKEEMEEMEEEIDLKDIEDVEVDAKESSKDEL